MDKARNRVEPGDTLFLWTKEHGQTVSYEFLITDNPYGPREYDARLIKRQVEDVRQTSPYSTNRKDQNHG